MMLSFSLLSIFLLFLFQDVSEASGGIVGYGLSFFPDACSLACHDVLSSLYLSCTTFSKHHGMPSDMDMGMGGGMKKRDMGMGMDMDMGMMEMGMTSDECRASNLPWLQTMAYCIHQSCGAHGYTMEKQAECFKTHAVAGASEPTFHDCLPETAPTQELAMNATWLNVTSLVNQHMYHATHGTLEEFARSEYLHTKYSMILYFIVIGSCLLWGTMIQVGGIFPSAYQQFSSSTIVSKFRQYVGLPAFFSSRHLEPLPVNLGYVPGRALGISIGIFVILNVVFSSVSFGSFQPNIYFPSERFELCEYIGNRTGMLSLVNISIAILFAGRNNILIAVTGWSQTTFLTFHRWAARVGTVQAIVHSIVYTIQYTNPGYEGAASYSEKAAEPFYWWGIIGTITLSLATAFAILPIRIIVYELFLVVHITLIVLTLVACWYHLVPHFGFEFGYQVWLYICFAFWSADRLARVVRIVYYNRLGNAKAIVEEVPGCNILHVTVFPRVTSGIGAGQHTFLYFPGFGKFWESHPFSIAAWNTGRTSSQANTKSLSSSRRSGGVYTTTKDADAVSPVTESKYQIKSTAEVVAPEAHKHNDNVSFQLLIRAHSGMTAKLHRFLATHPERPRVEISLYTEGCYAGHYATLQSLFTADTVLCLVGGLGITNALGFVQEYVNSGTEGEAAGTKARGVMRRARRFVLAWSAKERAFIDYVRRNFLAEAQGVELMFWHTGSDTSSKNEDAAHKSDSSPDDEIQKVDAHKPEAMDAAAEVTVGRMPIASVIRSSLEVGRRTTVLVCGPGRMADDARLQVVSCVKDGFSVDLVEEAFAW
ncbi:ferric reductase like transmembrane component-domain-containing protein [Nemania sp. FL0916]|nr:ferric reductase like transmembrane component-domain-containing protein [Nemania sp. FL0916]